MEFKPLRNRSAVGYVRYEAFKLRDTVSHPGAFRAPGRDCHRCMLYIVQLNLITGIYFDLIGLGLGFLFHFTGGGLCTREILWNILPVVFSNCK